MARELIDTGTDKTFVRRNKQGEFQKSDDVGRSLASDQKRDSKTPIVDMRIGLVMPRFQPESVSLNTGSWIAPEAGSSSARIGTPAEHAGYSKV